MSVLGWTPLWKMISRMRLLFRSIPVAEKTMPLRLNSSPLLGGIETVSCATLFSIFKILSLEEGMIGCHELLRDAEECNLPLASSIGSYCRTDTLCLKNNVLFFSLTAIKDLVRFCLFLVGASLNINTRFG